MGRPRKNQVAEAADATKNTPTVQAASLQLHVIKLRLTFTEPVLGTAPADKEIYTRFIASKAPDAASLEEEVDSLGAAEVAQRSLTMFNRDDDGCPILFDYQIKGFFKAAAYAMRQMPGSRSSEIKAYKRVIDTAIFPGPRKIRIQGAAEIGTCQRPLRAQTMQGERVALAYSEEIPAGAFIELEVRMLSDMRELVREWLNYGELSGIGQWHNSGKGRFTWEELA